MPSEQHQAPSSADHAEQQRLQALYDYEILDTEREIRFDRIVRLASRLIGVPISLVSLIDDSRQWFKAEVGLGLNETPRSMAFCAHAIKSDDVMVVEDATKDERFKDNPLVTGSPDIRFYAGAPLSTKDGHNLGTICVIDRRPRTITDEQREVLSDLAELVVDELELHRANKRLLHLATVDPLTGLLNRRAFFAAAGRELLRARRYGKPLSVMILDVDHFKRVNDTFGHEVGDRALRALAEMIQRGTREEAIAGRLGGEEFAVIVPEAAVETARIVAERIRGLAATIAIPTPLGDCVFTLSAGLTQVRPDDADFDTALKRADDALYVAKGSGRDRIVVGP